MFATVDLQKMLYRTAKGLSKPIRSIMQAVRGVLPPMSRAKESIKKFHPYFWGSKIHHFGLKEIFTKPAFSLVYIYLTF